MTPKKSHHTWSSIGFTPCVRWCNVLRTYENNIVTSLVLQSFFYRCAFHFQQDSASIWNGEEGTYMYGVGFPEIPPKWRRRINACCCTRLSLQQWKTHTRRTHNVWCDSTTTLELQIKWNGNHSHPTQNARKKVKKKNAEAIGLLTLHVSEYTYRAHTDVSGHDSHFFPGQIQSQTPWSLPITLNWLLTFSVCAEGNYSFIIFRGGGEGGVHFYPHCVWVCVLKAIIYWLKELCKLL